MKRMELKLSNYYTVPEIAKMRKVSSQAVIKRIQKNKVPSERVGTQYLIKKENYHLLGFK